MSRPPSTTRNRVDQSEPEVRDDARPKYACPVCGGRLWEIRGKLQCHQCHTICETCCEGGQP